MTPIRVRSTLAGHGSNPDFARRRMTGDAGPDPELRRKYRQAAVVYFAYGVYYLAGVIGLGRRSGWTLHGYGPITAGLFIAVGTAITIAFPFFVWRQVRWFTRALAIVVFARSAYLFTELTLPSFLGPFLVAVAAAWVLTRAGWDL